MLTDNGGNEVLSVSDLAAKLGDVEEERNKLARRVRELENRIESINLRRELQSRQRESAILLNAAHAIAEIDRLQREREELFTEKLKRSEEERASLQRREQELDKQLTQTVITRNEELVTQVRFDELKERVVSLELERDRLRTANTYLNQVVDNCRISSAKPRRNKNTQADARELGNFHSIGVQVGESRVQHNESTQ